MLIETLQALYARDLENLRAEIEKFPSDASLWIVRGQIANSAGNLALHICGNLQHFFGAVLGESGYVRDRDSEFSREGAGREELFAEIAAAAAAVQQTLEKLTPDDLAQTYPVEIFGHPMTTEFFLVHLATHLNYHLGQINYHRRLLEA